MQPPRKKVIKVRSGLEEMMSGGTIQNTLDVYLFKAEFLLCGEYISVPQCEGSLKMYKIKKVHSNLLCFVTFCGTRSSQQSRACVQH